MTEQEKQYDDFEELPETEDIAIQTQRFIKKVEVEVEKVTTPPLKGEKQQNRSENEEEEEYDKMDINALVPKVSNRQKLIEQNIKLKTQIYDLAKQIDEITKKPVKGKEQKEEDPLLRSKKLELKKHQIHLMQIRNKIFNIRHEIQSYDMLHINDLENRIKSVRLQMKQNQQQMYSLQLVAKSQKHAMEKQIPEQIDQKSNQNKQRLRQLKEEHKMIHNKLLDNERVIRKNHEQVVIKRTKIKEMEQKIAAKDKQKQKDSRKRSKSTQKKITDADISILEQQVDKMSKDKVESDKIWLNKIKIVEAELYNKKLEHEKKLLIVKEKEKQLRLYEIKLKQLNRLLKPVDIKKQTDISLFKYKRNIRYLQK